MVGGSIEAIIFVHGYSVTDLNSFNRLPALLASDGIETASIYLAGFISLHDGVSCEDLSRALELRVSTLERDHGLDLSRTMIVAHSTGAIITRRWMLDRRAAAKAGTSTKKTLSHFMSCAGANHGSTLAQLGLTELAHVIRLTEGRAVGRRVLDDLDYGSAFLRKLNAEWMETWNDPNDPLYADTFCFSMVGTDHSFWQNHLAWQAHEPGSDGTVRICGSNLNYRRIVIPPPPAPYELELPRQRAPHLVVESSSNRYAHNTCTAPDSARLVLSAEHRVSEIVHGYGKDPDPVSSVTYGIVDGILNHDERPYVAFKESLAERTLADYEALSISWDDETTRWSADNPSETNSTIVTAIYEAAGRLADSSIVFLRDTGGSIASVSRSLLPNQPIRNKVDPSVVSFYVNFDTFELAHPHSLRIDTHAAGGRSVFESSIEDDHVIGANEFTYVDVKLGDDARILALYQMGHPEFLDVLNQSFPPFDPRGLI